MPPRSIIIRDRFKDRINLNFVLSNRCEYLCSLHAQFFNDLKTISVEPVRLVSRAILKQYLVIYEPLLTHLVLTVDSKERRELFKKYKRKKPLRIRESRKVECRIYVGKIDWRIQRTGPYLLKN